MADDIIVEIQGDDIEVGETLHGNLVWTPVKDGTINRTKVSVGWRTEGRGAPKSGTVSELLLAGISMRAGETLRRPFALVLPALAPPSYDGTILRIIWEINVTVDPPLAIDVRKSLLVLAPGTRSRRARAGTT